jgi:hypothetical protein
MLSIGLGALSPVWATPGGDDDGHEVTICHRTNSASNPYTQNRVDRAAVDGVADEPGQGDHYANHVGPVFDPAADYSGPMSGDQWGDIIPPIQGIHDGLNWTAAGQAIWSNGCQVVEPTTTEPPVTTTEPPATTTEPPVTTTEPPVTTTEPPVTTTEPPVTTTEPPVTTSTGGVVDEGGGAVDEGGGAVDEGGGVVVEERPGVVVERPQGAAVSSVPRAATDGAELVRTTRVQVGLMASGFGLLVVAGLLSLRRREAE